MVAINKPIYRDENSKELNKLIETLLKNLEMENEVTLDIIMDMTFKHNERMENSFWETVKNPENYQKLITLQSRTDTLEPIISELKSIIYSDYKTLPPIKTPEPRMSSDECRMWLGTTVKPLILAGECIQQNISKELGINASTISTRVKSGYNKSWSDYVELVNQGVY